MDLQTTNPIEVKKNKAVSELLNDMSKTGFQGKKLAEAFKIMQDMYQDASTTLLFGYAGSLSTTGQWTIIKWLMDNNYIDILVSTGANISEDLIEAMGYNFYHVPPDLNDTKLFESGYNRYYDVCGKESDYIEMTEFIASFILTLDENHNYSSREFLQLFGLWLNSNNVQSIVTNASKNRIPIFCPAIIDSPFGDAILIAKSKGFNLILDSAKDYVEFMSLTEHVKETGVVYIGGGVPKDFIQLFAVTGDLLYQDRMIPNKSNGLSRKGTNEIYFPHKYAVQITTDSPQWGGLSGCTFNEAISWGKETSNGKNVQCFCDATIALPIIVHALADTLGKDRESHKLNKLFEEKA